MAETILVIDLGTTNIKAVAFDRSGRVVAEAIRPTPVDYSDGSMEIDPASLWTAVTAASREAGTSGRHEVAAVTMTTMAASFIPLDAIGRCLYPAIGWADNRSVPYMKKCLAAFTAENWIVDCGQYPLQMYLPFKIQWFAAVHPDKSSRVAKWLNVSDYIYSKLTDDNRYRTDYSVASRTMLFNIPEKRWNKRALDAFGIDENLLPKPVAPGTIIGTLGRKMLELGFRQGIPVIMGGHDHMCCIPGAGINDAETLLNTTGTSEAIVALLPNAPYDMKHIVGIWLNCEAAIQSGRTAVVGYAGSPGRVFQSVCQTLGNHGDSTINMPPDPGLIFLPPFRAQLVTIEGEMRGLTPQFDAPLLYRSICDGLYLECRRVAERIMFVRGGTKAKSMRMVGGHAKNLPEVRRKSAVLGMRIEIVKHPHITSLGAAMAASLGCGWYKSLDEASVAMCHGMTTTIEPDASLSERFEEIYRDRYLPRFPKGCEGL
jgi:xylulokinase